MRPAPFEYVQPRSIEELRAVLASDDGSAKVLAGGQSLVPMMNFRMASPCRLIDINAIAALDYIRADGNAIRIGALARHNHILGSALVRERCGVLAQAYGHVAHHTVRNRGTLAGNSCHADPASEMPAVLLTLDAIFHIDGANPRSVSASDFFLGMYTTAVGGNEYLREIEIPMLASGRRGYFDEISMRQGDFAICGVAAVMTVRNGVCSNARIAYCGIAEHQFRLTEAERWLEGRAANATTALACADLAASSVQPGGDVKASSKYRRHLVSVLTGRVLETIFNENGLERT